MEHPEFGNGWLLFSHPHKTLIAWNLDEIVPLLDTVDQLGDSGGYCAGFVSYDASPAFDSAFLVRLS